MNILKGIKYNLQGLWLGVKTPKLLLLGFIRFAVVIFITIISSGLILAYHQEILSLIWARPESPWIIWLWHVLSWLLSLILVGLAAVLSYLVSQILFSVLIMDYMSRITELMVTGQVNEPEQLSLMRLFSHLIKQEIPRTIIPVLLSLLLMILGFLTPLGPILAILTSCMAVIFLTWDNTDLVPARRLVPFNERFKLMSKTILFHLGFGVLFLIPGLNILFLSFAPVGATLYYIEKYDGKEN
ncbi:MAG: EI24 domain-containing protein [Deltaproteobacteria bacterium]|nr:EI24 domain-containing protein [Deltaproteobacteria bacterium]MBW1737198.1 EI24 domain-containing protein [Deltaproteobacteria bacterium]MBW1910685.1 EI24 domain-containing protein [Deltaproteobacteria bacterium]MBW2033813.1 EI24 domain-containing protein [Deltaproteobacteria bacterium]MBW2169492.1 EI24 domain-containing protein [Deltaproteobacteria bacterium]